MKAFPSCCYGSKVLSSLSHSVKLAATETKFKRGVALGVWPPSLRGAVPSPPPPPKVKWREDSLASVSPCGGRVRLQVGYWLPRCLGLFYGSQSREPKWRLINGVLLSMKIRILQAKTTKWLKATVNWNNTVNSYQSRRKLPKYKIKACKTNLT